MNSASTCSTHTFSLLFLCFVTALSAGAADSDDADEKRTVYSMYNDWTIRENSTLVPGEQTRGQKFTFAGKRGDMIRIGVNPAVRTWDANDNPLELEPGEFLRLRFDSGKGLETAPEQDDNFHTTRHRFAEDGTFVFYVTTKQAGQLGRFRLGVQVTTRLPPAPVFAHIIHNRQLESGHIMTFRNEIAEDRHLQVEVTGTDFTPIIEFGRGAESFEVFPWGERRERGHAVWAMADRPVGACTVRVSAPGKRGGSFRLEWMIPCHLRPEE